MWGAMCAGVLGDRSKSRRDRPQRRRPRIRGYQHRVGAGCCSPSTSCARCACGRSQAWRSLLDLGERQCACGAATHWKHMALMHRMLSHAPSAPVCWSMVTAVCSPAVAIRSSMRGRPRCCVWVQRHTSTPGFGVALRRARRNSERPCAADAEPGRAVRLPEDHLRAPRDAGGPAAEARRGRHPLGSQEGALLTWCSAAACRRPNRECRTCHFVLVALQFTRHLGIAYSLCATA